MASLQFKRNVWRESYCKSEKPDRREGGVCWKKHWTGRRVWVAALTKAYCIDQASKSSNPSTLTSCAFQEDQLVSMFSLALKFY